MHSTTAFSLIPVAMTNHSVILEAPDAACGYLDSMERARFGCLANSEKCAIYYPTSSMAATPTTEATMNPMITPAPQPSLICCEPSGGYCNVQPTACVDILEDCTGTCSNDPMTLKCTIGAHRHCNRAHFESPLYFRHMEALDVEMRPTDTPADGWFCGPSAIPIEHINESQRKSVSTSHISHGSVSLSATLSVTITLSKPGLQPAPSPGLPLPGTVVSEDTNSEGDAHGSDDCCFDEPGTDEPCYDDAHRARLRQRHAIDGSTTNALPAAVSAGPITRGSAIVSTAYIGQTDRAPYVEATRPWSIVIPTAVANSTKNDTRPPRRPKPPKGKKHKKYRLSKGGKIAIIVLVPTAVGFLIVVYVWRKDERLPFLRPRGADQQQQEHAPDGTRPAITRGLRQYIEGNYGRIGTFSSRPNQQVPYGFRYEDMPRRPEPAHERDQHASPESGEAADDEQESALHSGDFLEPEALDMRWA